MTRLTVAIITHNRANILYETLQALCTQDAPSDSFEVLVVDNASTDDTASVVSSFGGQQVAVRYSYEATLGIPYARNRTLAETTTPLIAYLDDDAIPVREWVSAYLTAYESISPTPSCVGGRILLRWTAGQPTWLHEEMASTFGYLNYGDTLKPVPTLFGGNLSFQTAILKQYVFHPGLTKTSLGEETQILEQMQRAGSLLYYLPQATVWHVVGQSRERPQYVVRRYYLSGITQAIMTVLDRFPGRLRLLRELERHLLLAHRNYGISATDWYNVLSRRALPLTPDALLRRCKFAMFVGFEHQLLKFFRKGSFYASDDPRLIRVLGG